MKSSLLYIVQLLFAILPESRCFALKNWLLKCCGVSIGRNVRICSSVRILGSGSLVIGDNTWIGHQCLIIASSHIEIGRNVDIAPRVYIGTGTHIIDTASSRIASTDISKDVRIGDGCWIGANSTILPGVNIRKKCVVASGAVVTKSYDEDAIMVGGVPAMKIKNL